MITIRTSQLSNDELDIMVKIISDAERKICEEADCTSTTCKKCKYRKVCYNIGLNRKYLNLEQLKRYANQ